MGYHLVHRRVISTPSYIQRVYKTFWKTVKPFLTDKVKIKSKVTLTERKQKQNQAEIFEEEKIICDDKEIAEIFNELSINIVPNLNITTDHFQNLDFQRTENSVLNAINKYRYHSSIAMIKSKIDKQLSFLLRQYNMNIFFKKL